MIDLKLVNTLDGGELEQSGNDFALVGGVENTVFLALFGGSKWVGNFLTDKPYESKTEQALNTVTLNSDGRMQIEQAVNSDLEYLNNIPGTTWTATVAIVGPNKVQIGVNINGEQFNYLWNPVSVSEVSADAISCTIPTGLTLTVGTSTSLSFSWDASAVAFFGYEYFLTTTPVEPVGSGTITTATNVMLSGLISGTTYYFWLRCRCAPGHVSAFISDMQVTIPIPPITSDLVGSYYSTYGVELDGSGLFFKWNDLSGKNNHLSLGALQKPTILPDIFGSKPALSFEDSGADQHLATSGNFIGLTGSKECTIFVVCQCTGVLGPRYIFAYGLSGTHIELFKSGSGSGKINLISITDASDINSGTIPIIYGDNIVTTSKFNANLAAINEQTIYVNGDNSGYVNVVNHDNTAGFNAQIFRVGQAQCKLACILVYKVALNNTDRAAVENSLMTYFSI
jgi:hypothetical protein